MYVLGAKEEVGECRGEEERESEAAEAVVVRLRLILHSLVLQMTFVLV